MAAFLVVLLAALTRFVPYAVHGVGMNFTAVWGGLLFFGSRRPRWQSAFAVVVLALSDVCLTTLVFGLHFHITSYLVTWAWYAAVCLIGSALLCKPSVLGVAAGVLASSTGFFLLSNFMVWAGSVRMYPHTATGLVACYVAGFPFYLNDLVSTTLTAGALFGLPVVAAKILEAVRTTQSRNEPLS